MIRQYFRDDHKTQGEWKFHSGNTLVDYNNQGNG